MGCPVSGQMAAQPPAPRSSGLKKWGVRSVVVGLLAVLYMWANTINVSAFLYQLLYTYMSGLMGAADRLNIPPFSGLGHADCSYELTMI